MKKLIITLFCAALILTAAACSTKQEQQPANPGPAAGAGSQNQTNTDGANDAAPTDQEQQSAPEGGASEMTAGEPADTPTDVTKETTEDDLTAEDPADGDLEELVNTADVVMNAVRAGDNKYFLEVNIENKSDLNFFFGVMYWIEKQTDAGWTLVEPKEDMVWIEIAYELAPKGTYSENVDLTYGYGALEDGIYRIGKTLMVDGARKDIYAKFEVK